MHPNMRGRPTGPPQGVVIKGTLITVSFLLCVGLALANQLGIVNIKQSFASLGGGVSGSDCALVVHNARLIPQGMWHSSRDDGDRLHKGLDLMAPLGTPIYAVKDGTVEWAGERKNSGWGTLVFLRHADKSTSAYAHIASWQVKVGDQAKKGQQIATIGATGNADPDAPHVHLEIGKPGDDYSADTNVDPVPWLKNCDGGWDPKWEVHKAK